MKYFYLISLILIAFLWGCKKEYPTLKEETNYQLIDLTGKWNGYKYNSWGGLVPLETIEIKKSSTNPNYYVATKIMGDNAVLSGWKTWEGEFTGKTSYITIYLGDGVNAYPNPGIDMTIENENTLSSADANLVFIRWTHVSL